MARYKLTLSYDGTGFSGSQRQAHGRTVQSELEKALRGLGWKAFSVILAGRTDAGVHAMGQVAAVELNWRHDVDALRKALNAKLPEDLAVVKAEAVAADFHPRFDAVSRRYRYRFYCRPERDPLQERISWRVWPRPEQAALAEVSGLLIGRHDFGAFGSPAKSGGSTVRTVTDSHWALSDDAWEFEIAADGFLYRMVRRLVFVQVAVGQGKCRSGAVARALTVGRRASSGLPAGTAPAQGLILVGVDY